MPDMSELDKKYFVDQGSYNCPFCNRRNVSYGLEGRFVFNWSDEKSCFIYLVRCFSCRNISMHLSYECLPLHNISHENESYYRFDSDVEDIDSKMFYSVPTSFFVIDSRIPEEIRELIAEAEGCLKMNYLTGASACARKAIYELSIREGAEGKGYEEKIKSLKPKYPNTAPELFDTLAHIQGMTSDKIHEQSWPKWDSNNLKLMLETLKAVLYEIYVLPEEKKARSLNILKLKRELNKDRKQRAKKKGKPKEGGSKNGEEE